MADGDNSSVKPGGYSLETLNKLAQQGVSVEDLLKKMSPQEINDFLVSQYKFLSDKYDSIEEQFKSTSDIIRKGNDDTSQRMQRILSLMTANLAFMKQMIQLEDDSSDKLAEQERVNAKQELQFSSVIDRQNRFAQSLANMDKNSQAIIKEIEKLKEKCAEHDKFQIRVTTIVTLIAGALAWLMTGDNFAKLIVFLNSVLPK